jgi:hypothetical protein
MGSGDLHQQRVRRRVPMESGRRPRRGTGWLAVIVPPVTDKREFSLRNSLWHPVFEKPDDSDECANIEPRCRYC